MEIKHILKTKDFAETLKEGKRVKGTTFSLYHLKENTKVTTLSVGLIISKKMVPLAVRRNYIRRVLYSYVEDAGKSLGINGKIVLRMISRTDDKKSKTLSKSIREEVSLLLSGAKDRCKA